MKKALLPINIESITIELFNHYDFYYRVNETDYLWCINWSDYQKRKMIYLEWLIRIPMSDISKFC